MALFESGEMYLENILVLRENGKSVRAIDLSEHMGYSRASVSHALAKLKSEGFLLTGPDGELLFTEKGLDTAKKIYERHILITRFLKGIGVDEKTAELDACRIEHVISDETVAAMRRVTAK